LNKVINDVLQNKIDPSIARTVIYGSQTLMAVFELKLMEEEIQELMQIAKDHYGHGGW
jgi:hypothetical protein